MSFLLSYGITQLCAGGYGDKVNLKYFIGFSIMGTGVGKPHFLKNLNLKLNKILPFQ